MRVDLSGWLGGANRACRESNGYYNTAAQVVTLIRSPQHPLKNLKSASTEKYYINIAVNVQLALQNEQFHRIHSARAHTIMHPEIQAGVVAFLAAKLA